MDKYMGGQGGQGTQGAGSSQGDWQQYANLMDNYMGGQGGQSSQDATALFATPAQGASSAQSSQETVAPAGIAHCIAMACTSKSGAPASSCSAARARNGNLH